MDEDRDLRQDNLGNSQNPEPQEDKAQPGSQGGTPQREDWLRQREEELLRRERELLERERSFMDRIMTIGQLKEQAQEVGFELSPDELIEAQDNPEKFRELVEKIAEIKLKREYGDIAQMKEELERLKYERAAEKILKEIKSEMSIYSELDQVEKGFGDMMVLAALDIAKLSGQLPQDIPVTPDLVKRYAREMGGYLERFAKSHFPKVYKKEEAPELVERLKANQELYAEVKRHIIEEYLKEQEAKGVSASVIPQAGGSVSAPSGEVEKWRKAARSREMLANLIEEVQRKLRKGV